MQFIRVYEILKMAIKSLYENKVRTFLSVLGVVIGTSSIVAAVGLVQTVSSSFTKQVKESGADSLILFLSYQPGYQTDYYELLKYLMKQKDLVLTVTPKKSLSLEVLSSDNNKKKCEILLVRPNYYITENLQLVDGRFLSYLDEDRNTKVAVVFDDQKDKLFEKGQQVLGKKLWIKGYEFEVVGVVKKKERLADISIGSASDISILVPFNVGESLFGSDVSSQQFFIKCVSSEKNKEVQKIIEEFLTQKGFEKEDYTFLDGREILQGVISASYLLSALLGGVATVSLFVSGIGITNIILVSVTERTKEIGIRKAVGAKIRDIRFQFLVESSIISIAGGIMGIVLGIVVVYAVIPNLMNNVQPTISTFWILFALGVSGVVGVFSGWAPAERAARLEPSIALRYE
jgi:putative ABC transport system permease protein